MRCSRAIGDKVIHLGASARKLTADELLSRADSPHAIVTLPVPARRRNVRLICGMIEDLSIVGF
jgi:hypothetical protein